MAKKLNKGNRMNKLEIQKRVSQYGESISIDKFEWDEKTNTFSSNENYLVIDFYNIDGCTFKTGDDCTFKTGYSCTFDTGYSCTFDTGTKCTFDTGDGCTFKTGYDCTFKTGSSCTFKTGYSCTFDTGYKCTFDTGDGCTFKTGYDCVIVRRDIFEIIQPLPQQKIQLCPYNILGYIYLDENVWYKNDTKKESIITDNILSEVISKKKNKDITVFKVKNFGKDKTSYLIECNGVYSHGKTIKEARESLIYKNTTQDTSVYNNMNLDTILDFTEMVKMYRAITGACAGGCQYFVETNNIKIKKYSIKEIIELTKNQYGNEKVKEFFKIK
jgi:hypothetical protein